MLTLAHHGRWARWTHRVRSVAALAVSFALLASTCWAGRAWAQNGANRAGDIHPAARPQIERQPLGPTREASGDARAEGEAFGDGRVFADSVVTRAQPPTAPQPPRAPTAAEARDDEDAGAADAAARRAANTGAEPADPSDRLHRMAKRFADDASDDGRGDQDVERAADRSGQAAGRAADTSNETAAGAGSGEPDTSASASDASSPARPALEMQPIGPRSSDDGTLFETKQPPRESGNWVINTLGALGLVIGLVFLLRWGLMRWSGGAAAARPSSVVEVLARVPVAARSHVLLLRMGGRILVVGDGAGGMRTLAEVDEPEEVADLLAAVTASRPNSMTQSFRHLFERFNGDYRDEGDPAEVGGERNEFQMDRTRDGLSGLIGRVRSIGRKGEGR